MFPFGDCNDKVDPDGSNGGLKYDILCDGEADAKLNTVIGCIMFFVNNRDRPTAAAAIILFALLTDRTIFW